MFYPCRSAGWTVKTLDVIPDNLNDEGLKEAYLYANRNTWTKAELDAYIDEGVRKQDGIGAIQKAVRDIVVKALKEGLPFEIISKISGLPVSEIEKIAEAEE